LITLRKLAISVLGSLICLGLAIPASVLSYVYILKVDGENCLEKLGNQFGVDSNYQAVTEALESHFEEVLNSGMTREDIYKALEQIGPIRLLENDPLSDEHNILVELKTCSFFENNWLFLFRFDYAGKFLKVTNIVLD
jgi:hypothetical protein